MNKNTKIALGTIAAVIIVGGGTYFYVCSRIDNVEKIINESLAKIQPELPKGAVQQNVLHKGFLSSDGIYTLDMNDKNEKSKVIVKYQIDHGIGSWFTNRYNVTAQTNIEGAIKTDLAYTGNFVNSEGVINGNGDTDLTSHYPQMTLTDNEDGEVLKAVIAPALQTVKYNHTSGDVKTHTEIPTMSISSNSQERSMASLNFSGIKYDYDFNKINPLVAKMMMDVQTVKTKMVEIDGFLLNGSSELNMDKYNFHIGMKADKVIIPLLKEKDGSFDFAFSIKNVDKAAVEYYQSLYDKSNDSDSFSKEEEQKAKENMKSLLRKGINMGLDKFIAKGSFGVLNVSGALNIKPDDAKTFSVSKNAELALNVKGEGYIAPMLNMYLANSEFKDVQVDKDKFNIVAKYTDNKLTVNDKDYSKTMMANNLQAILLEEDVSLGFMSTDDAIKQYQQNGGLPDTTDTEKLPSSAPGNIHLLPADSETKI